MGIPGSPIHKPIRKGLDLQGGLEVVLKAHPPAGVKLSSTQLDRAVNIMEQRINKLGVNEPIVTKQGSNEIVIELAGIHNPDQALAIIGKTAQLEFYDLEADLVSPSIDVQGFPVATPTLYGLLARVQADAQKGKPSQWYLFNAKKKLVAGPLPTRDALLAKRGGKLPKGWKAFAAPEHTVVIHCEAASGCPGVGQSTPVVPTYFYLFKHNLDAGVPEMTGNELKLSGTRQDFDPNTNEPIVTMQFTKKGAKIFHAITRKEAERGRTRTSLLGHGQDLFQHFAIVLDREIKSAPYIDFHQNPDGIEGSNGAQITGIGSVGDAKNLALVLQTGALPVNFSIAERTDVSATLGKDSLRQAERAALVGLLIVALFLLLLYRFLGLVAVIGLGIYAAFLYAAIAILGVTLTLPGFAGLILTIGVAADANVVIFERIKEEVRSGKSVRAAVAAGYAKGFRTILDANVVTCITALVLFAVATAGVKGKGSSVNGNYSQWQVRTKSLSADQQRRLTDDLKAKVGAYATGAKNVSASFGRQIARSAIIAILFSLFLIVLYIAVRFDIKFAVPVIVALLHDIVITVGVYSLTGREVSTSTVAAVLTVLGYSIYDTIIIFDRIREDIALMRRAPFATIA